MEVADLEWFLEKLNKMFKFKIRHRKPKNPDYVIVVCTVLLVLFGLAMLSSASSNTGKSQFGDANFFLKRQIINGLSVGILGFLLASVIYYKYYAKFALIFLITSIVALSLVFTPLGLTAKGATRWVSIGPVNFQPSEIVKIFLIIYLAAWLSADKNRTKDLKRGFIPFLIVTAVIVGLLLKQPATSTTTILFVVAITMYFMSGAKMKYLALLGLLAAIGFAAVIYSTPYRLERVLTFLHPEENAQTSGFHLTQALNAIGSGGLTGVGYGQSTTKLRYLPEPEGDSIFAVIAEEFGFLGSAFVIILFAVLVFRLIILSKRAPDQFGSLLLIGFSALISLQVFFHIAAISGLVPITGIPLPFISYGGTSLAIMLTMMGISVNISRYT